MVTVSRKQHFPLSSHSLGHYTPFSVGSDLWRRLRKGRAVGAAVLVLPSSQSCFLSHPLSDPIWMGWPSFLSRGNSTHTAASSCVSSSVLTEELDSRAWNRARKISWPSLPPSLGGCLNHSKGERCLFSSPKPPSFFFFFPFLAVHIFKHWCGPLFSWRLGHQDHIWINLVPGQTVQLHTFIP